MRTPPKEDLVEFFFNILPKPKAVSLGTDDMFVDLFRAAIGTFITESRRKEMSKTDMDYRYLLEHAKISMNHDTGGRYDHHYFVSRLIQLTLENPMGTENNSMKAQHFRFWRWVARGQRDEKSPFIPAQKASSAEDRICHAYLPSRPSSIPCANCGKLGATLRCGNCLILTDEHETYSMPYCTRECQAKHWKWHHTTCKVIKPLYRAMALFQDIFTDWCTLTNPSSVLYIEETENMVRYCTVNDDNEGAFRGKMIASKFPTSLHASWMTALMTDHSKSPQTTARPLLERFLSAVSIPYNTLIEVHTTPRNADKTTAHTSRHPDTDALWHTYNTTLPHRVLLIPLPDGTHLVLDSAAAALGWRDTLVPWAAYRKHRVVNVTHRAPVETMIHPLRGPGEISGRTEAEGVVLRRMVCEDVALAVKLRFGEERLRAVLGMDGEEWEGERGVFRDFARRRMEKEVERLEGEGVFRLYYDLDFALWCTVSKEEAEKLKYVWFTAKEYRNFKKKGIKKLQDEWEKRWRKELGCDREEMGIDP
ncbi:hypothetical protein B0T25DRAFT_614407 [Lasiosphaeria hispida]|uniref:MYND-type domain-containing protein n=1 Tax=Lasiosphaeria hispida TaxID=260671 RepID=A0AAJ0H7Z8_9PEZI|nr:hypothetical protein B0T25DRAFT_614407 [Lasiosphaeria hispida]